MRGSEDWPEAAGSAGAARGSGLPPVNDCYPEGLRSGVAVGGAGPAEVYWCLLVELHEEKDFALKPHFT